MLEPKYGKFAILIQCLTNQLSTDPNNLNAIELELVKEKATALGRAGRKLRLALEKHTKDPNEKSILNIRHAIWELMIQREIVGINTGNMEWIKENYVSPAEALVEK